MELQNSNIQVNPDLFSSKSIMTYISQNSSKIWFDELKSILWLLSDIFET